jgi:hypothetical protein
VNVTPLFLNLLIHKQKGTIAMYVTHIQIAEHVIEVSTPDPSIHTWIRAQFMVLGPEQWNTLMLPDLFIHIRQGYGSPLDSYTVEIQKESDRIRYIRDDFHMTSDDTYRRTELLVHDELALKHALMTLYSAFIVYYGFGLLIHSSCVVNENQAYLFAGPSGAGKSTVALLSKPRALLSDEATLLRIEPHRVVAYDSPFRSDSLSKYDHDYIALAGIHLLKQSTQIQRSTIKSSEAIVQLMDKVFYWAHEPVETLKVLELMQTLLRQVPAYELEFQKNDLFWEMIS